MNRRGRPEVPHPRKGKTFTIRSDILERFIERGELENFNINRRVEELIANDNLDRAQNRGDIDIKNSAKESYIDAVERAAMFFKSDSKLIQYIGERASHIGKQEDVSPSKVEADIRAKLAESVISTYVALSDEDIDLYTSTWAGRYGDDEIDDLIKMQGASVEDTAKIKAAIEKYRKK